MEKKEKSAFLLRFRKINKKNPLPRERFLI